MFLRISILALLSLSLVACGSTDPGSDPDSGTHTGDGGPIQLDANNGDGGGLTDAQRDGFIIATDGGQTDTGTTTGNFSFFVTSLARIRQLSGSQNGFGGDLRYGFTGQGAGLKGADKICSDIAELSMTGAGTSKTWRAFLSVTKDESGVQVNAIDRIGNGPWYDRLGRLVAPNKSSLLSTRPLNGDATIKNDLPNEDGVPNHNPDSTGNVDNHDILTGSNSSGQLYGSKATCLDWTAKTGSQSTEGVPRVGHSWPTGGGGGGGGGGDMSNWMSALDEAGCAPAVYLIDDGAAHPGSNGVGSGGGYGGFYCFALTP